MSHARIAPVTPARLLVALLVVLSVTAVGCGDDDDVGVGDETTTDDAAPGIEGPVNDEGTETISGGSVTIELIDFAFDPTFLSDGAETVDVQLDNTGAVAHTFTIESLDIDEVLDPGQQAEITVDLAATDDPLEFVCRFHVAQGMKGAFGGSAQGAVTDQDAPERDRGY